MKISILQETFFKRVDNIGWEKNKGTEKSLADLGFKQDAQVHIDVNFSYSDLL
jgi:hypothetical protein